MAYHTWNTSIRRTGLRKTRIIAVVGSLGKTTTMRSVSSVLDITPHKNAHRNFKSGLALSLLRLPISAPHGVVEVGIDQAGLMGIYARMILPDVTVVTSTEKGEKVYSERGLSMAAEMSMEQLIDKFKRNAKGIIGESKTEEAIEAILGLDDLKDISMMMRLLVP